MIVSLYRYKSHLMNLYLGIHPTPTRQHQRTLKTLSLNGGDSAVPLPPPPTPKHPLHRSTPATLCREPVKKRGTCKFPYSLPCHPLNPNLIRQVRRWRWYRRWWWALRTYRIAQTQVRRYRLHIPMGQVIKRAAEGFLSSVAYTRSFQHPFEPAPTVALHTTKDFQQPDDSDYHILHILIRASRTNSRRPLIHLSFRSLTHNLGLHTSFNYMYFIVIIFVIVLLYLFFFGFSSRFKSQFCGVKDYGLNDAQHADFKRCGRPTCIVTIV